MNTHADKTQENKSQSVANDVSQKKSSSESTFQFIDNRSEAIAQRKLQEMANDSFHTKKAVQLQAMADNYSAQKQPLQRKENNTGLPDNLKTGMENLSGYSMDDVKVHYNSDKPAQLQAHAYAQGTHIHLASGQEQHLPHEAWHVVQQKQGRVKPTLQMKGKVNVNDDAGLEKEADVMGAKALLNNSNTVLPKLKSSNNTNSATQRLKVDGMDKWVEIPWEEDSGMIPIVLETIKLELELAIQTVREEGFYHFEAGGMKWLLEKNDIPVLELFFPESLGKVNKDSTEQQLSHNVDGGHYFQESGVNGERASSALKAIQENFGADEIIPKDTLIETLIDKTGLDDEYVKKAILFLRKNDSLFPSYPGPKLTGIKKFSLDKTKVIVEETTVADKSLTDKIKSIISTEGIQGSNIHDKVRNALIKVIVHPPDEGVWDGYRSELINLFKNQAAAKYYTDTYVRAGDEHEQLITSMTADQVLYDLEHPTELPVTDNGKVTHLDFQHSTNVPTNYVVLKTVTSHSNYSNKVSQNHHPTSNDLISFVDHLDANKFHGSPGSGQGSSPQYHKELASKIGKEGILQLNQELTKVNINNLAGRFDILNIPETERVSQSYAQTNGDILYFNNKADLHKIARNVEVRRRKVLGLFYAVKKLLKDDSDFLSQSDVLDMGADSDEEMNDLPKTPKQYE